MDRQTLVTAIATADAAGVAYGFERGLQQVADNLRQQAAAWRAATAEQQRAARWWWALLPWRFLAMRSDAAATESSASAVERISAYLIEAIEKQRSVTEERKTEANNAAEAALAMVPMLAPPVAQAPVEKRTFLGGAAEWLRRHR